MRRPVFLCVLWILVLPQPGFSWISSGVALLEEDTFVFMSNRDRSGRAFDVFVRTLKDSQSINLTAGLEDVALRSSSAPRLCRLRNSVVVVSYLKDPELVEIDIQSHKIRHIAPLKSLFPEFDISPDGASMLCVEHVDSTWHLVEWSIGNAARHAVASYRFPCAEPTYSRDGRWIAFLSGEDGTKSVAIVHRDGSGYRLLTNHFGEDRHPRFSPDGARIVFSSSRGGCIEGEYELYLVDTGGQNMRLFYDSRAYNNRPQFTADGSAVVFLSSSTSGRASHVFVSEIGSGKTTDIVKDLPWICSSFSTCNDGRHILIEYTTLENSEILLYDRETGVTSNVTGNRGRNCAPSF
jgi:Tol biopolymer transport system component